jgi:ketosteroid isomerase-like protein
VDSKTNKQVVSELYAAFGRGDIVSLLALVAEDVDWRLPGTVPHYSGSYKSPAVWPASLKARCKHWHRSLRTARLRGRG